MPTSPTCVEFCKTSEKGRSLLDNSWSRGEALANFERAERLFKSPKYIHLVRHPYAVIELMARHRFQKMLGAGDVDPYELGEEVWRRQNDNIAAFLWSVTPTRHTLVTYESLVTSPQEVIEKLSSILEIPFDEALLKPYERVRMTDGIHPHLAPLGNSDFNCWGSIEASLERA